MARLKAVVALAAAGTALAACNMGTPAQLSLRNPSINSVNQPVVQRTDFVMDLNAGGGGVSDAELLRLTAWLESLRLGYGDRVYVEEAYGDGPARRDVARVVSEFGVLLSDGAPVVPGQVQPGAARVIVSRSTASVPGCPNWQWANLTGAPTTTDTNYGCAVNSNLAAMIADPQDLVRGQAGGSDPEDGTRAITSYRNRATVKFQTLKRESTGGR